MPRPWSVGYKKPPTHSRFRKGVSGNPSGRPKRSRDVPGTILKLLDRPITIRIDGRHKTMSRFDVIVTQLINLALKGDLKATKAIIELRLIAENWRQENIEHRPLTVVLTGDDVNL